MRQNWPEVPIRSTYLGLFDGPHATPSPVDDGPVFLGIGNLTEDGHLDLNQTKHISEADFPKWTKRVVPMAGDIVFTYEATLNRYAIIPSGFHGCLGRRLALIRPNPEVVDTRWLHYYFFGREWRSVIAANTLSGATVDRIPLTTFPDFPVRLPPLKTQRRIASILSAYDDLIENNTRRIAILEEMARRIYEEWFVRFRFPGHEQVKMVESELGLIPEGWHVRTMSEVAEVIDCLHSKKPERTEEGTGLLLQLDNIGDGGKLDLTKRYVISDADYQKWISRMEAQVGDCVVTNVGRVGAVAQIPHGVKAALGRNMTGIRAKTSLMSPTYLIQYLLSSHMASETLKKKDAGTIMDSLNVKGIIRLAVPIAPKVIMEQFDQLVSPIRKMIEVLVSKNANLRTTRDLLLPKLISGELDVSTLSEPEEAIAA